MCILIYCVVISAEQYIRILSWVIHIIGWNTNKDNMYKCLIKVTIAKIIVKISILL